MKCRKAIFFLSAISWVHLKKSHACFGQSSGLPKQRSEIESVFITNWISFAGALYGFGENYLIFFFFIVFEDVFKTILRSKFSLLRDNFLSSPNYLFFSFVSLFGRLNEQKFSWLNQNCAVYLQKDSSNWSWC